MEMVCPIHSIVIPGLSDPLELKGLIVVVGPNSSGKSQLLHDMNEVVLGKERRLVVLSSVKFNAAPNYEELVNLLIQNGTIKETQNNRYQKHSFQLGAEEGGGDLDINMAKSQHNSYKTTKAEKLVSNQISSDQFLRLFGPLSCSAPFLKNRLTLMDACSNFNTVTNAPTTTLQALYLNESAKEQLRNEIAATFKRGLWIDPIGQHGQLIARVADVPAIPSAEDRLKPGKMGQCRGIETEGDGIRSYVAICAALLMERRPLCIIDEPEMCLHPPQAHAMGRFIGKHVSPNTATVISTHSSHILRGILEANPTAHVIRLSRDGLRFKAKLLKPDALAEATSKPRSRSETILEGLFAQGVIVCEADGDRIVYESTYQTLKDRKLDIRFIPSEGTGGFADPLKLYSALGVPTAVIADLDFLRKDGELRKVLVANGVDDEITTQLCDKAKEIMQFVRAAADCLDTASVQSRLKMLAESNDSNDAIRGKLLKLTDEMYRLRNLQQVGIDSIPEEYKAGVRDAAMVPLRSNVKSLVGDLAKYGLFLVPVGVLESWMPILMNGISREDKSKWAMMAAEKIETLGEREEDIWLFLRKIIKYLSDGVEPASASQS